MPSVRFSRDKRGYEYVYLMHTSTRRGKPGRSQVLYWYRTPPGVRIGRKPFSDDVQRMLEAQNPGVEFDWPAIINTPMPPPDMTEFWREKRRAAKAARQERRTQETDSPDSDDSQPDDSEGDMATPAPSASSEPETEVVAVASEEAVASDVANPEAGARKRRRRRGGRRRKGPGDAQVAGESAPADESELSDSAASDPADETEPTEPPE